MAGNRESGLRSAETNKRKYGPDFYHIIGKKSAEVYLAQPVEDRKPRGFAVMDKTKLKAASAKGGRSKKGFKKA